MAKRVLVLRPRAPGLRTAAHLSALGIAALAVPVLRIEPTDAPMPEGPFDAICVTSAAALHRMAMLPDALKALPLLAVGERTGLMARAAGFAHVHAAEGERHSLAALVRDFFHGRASPRLLLALGQDHKPDTPALLQAAGADPVPWIVYAARAEPALPETVATALRDGTADAAVHYSRRSATVACELAGQAGLWPAFAALTHYALSDDVAAPLRERGAARVLVAGHPHEDALLALFAAIDHPQGSP